MAATYRRTAWCVALWAVLHAGCAELTAVKPPPARPTLSLLECPPQADAETAAPTTTSPQDDTTLTASVQVTADSDVAPLADNAELRLESLIASVLARNPTMAQMTAAWQAASAKYPQAISLDDPMFGATIGPASFGSNEVDAAYRLEVSQKIPWHGKRDLRGQNALAEASAAGHDVDNVRLQLVESARSAFYDYYLVERALEVNDEAQRLLKDLRQNALERFTNRLAPEQDFRQAEVELGRQRERQLNLERMKLVTVARINALMHLPTSSPVLPPPKKMAPTEPLPEASALQELAAARRPDLKALADRIAADQALLALAYKEFYPDVDLMAAYDAFWQPRERDLRPMLGVRLNLPVRKDRRYAALAEAQARIAQRQADLARQLDQVNLQVEEAFQMVRESEKAVQLYDKTILPAARENVKAAIAAYTTGKTPFLSLIEAQRNLINLRDRYYEATADVYRRRAVLERAIGGP